MNPQKSNTGLYYIIKTEGTGNTPNENSTITTYYKGYNTDSISFDESKPEGIEFKMDMLIEGFKEGMTYLKEGGEATFIIPSKLAYANSTYSALRYEVLIFDVKLINVN
ncbi:FKBP-type peptidyl-prolyl cis-trans isomerase [Polaribacter sp. Hel1_85]|uniref:FKBP-type peptidyl-prolyl cis-trans isomerase n=1 Tax=Polaribacter sp. Hel1_85 TaxID=1250005 RepID=UPI00052DECD0|nr:FKBP-type peptidyl-prolyl cis-trans isomerase [Polaribacter sp. Hel1_85]KGL62778.1 FKBP-type peptidyl-prolyl cis-trans isomerase (rotamase) [Polaribacter sp. Hel1_85]